MKKAIFDCEKADAQTAFTQVELLVLVAVIGALGMLGLAASAKLSNQTKIAQCSVNLRQLNLAQLLYASDNSDNLPRNTVGSWAWDMSGSVATSLLPYGLVQRTFYCPGTAPRFNAEQNLALWNYNGGSLRVIGYAITLGGTSALPATNQNFAVFPQPTAFGSLVTPPQPPAQRVLTADGNLSQDGVNFTSITGGFIYNGSSYPHICPHLDGAYPAGGNVGMLDGHVEWRPFKQMTVRTPPAVNGAVVPGFYW